MAVCQCYAKHAVVARCRVYCCPERYVLRAANPSMLRAPPTRAQLKQILLHRHAKRTLPNAYRSAIPNQNFGRHSSCRLLLLFHSIRRMSCLSGQCAQTSHRVCFQNVLLRHVKCHAMFKNAKCMQCSSGAFSCLVLTTSKRRVQKW